MRDHATPTSQTLTYAVPSYPSLVLVRVLYLYMHMVHMDIDRSTGRRPVANPDTQVGTYVLLWYSYS